MNQIFDDLSLNEDLPKLFFTKNDITSSIFNKHHLLDVIPPCYCTVVEDYDVGPDSKFVGHCANGECICYVDQYGEENLTNFFVYNYNHVTDGLERYCRRSVQNIRGSRSYEAKIFSSDRSFCLLFSEERSNVHVASVSFGLDFKAYVYREDILVLTDSRRGSKYFMSPRNDLLVAIQCYQGNLFTYLTIHFAQVLNQNGEISARLLTNETLQIKHNGKLLDCRFICNCSKIVVITDSPSSGNVFICYSVSPFVKLFMTKIQCSRANGWFFVEDSLLGEKLVTYNDTGDRDGIIEIFSCDDDRTFVPVRKFKLSNLGCRPELPYLNISVKGYRMFLCTAEQAFVINLNMQQIMFTLGLNTRNPQINVSSAFPINPGVIPAVSVSVNRTEVIINRSFVTDESGVQTISIFMLPQQQFTLFGLCRLAILRNYNKDQILAMNLPRQLKDTIICLKNNFYKN